MRRAIFFVVLLSGCSFFSKSKSTIYSLERIPGTSVAAVRGTPIGIDAVEMPPGFDRREIVVRQADHKLDVRASQLWASALSDQVLHTLSFDLQSRLPEGMVVLPGQAKPSSMRAVTVVFEEFSAGPDPVVTLDAHWLEHREHITVPIPSLDSKDVATGYSQALAQLADKMAQ